VAAVLGAAGISLLLYFRNRKNTDLPKNIKYILAGFRFFSIAFILLLLLNIFLKQLKNETQNPIIILAVDNSSSIIQNKDSSFIKGEFQTKIKLLEKNLSEKFEIKKIFFGSATEISTQNKKDKPDFLDKETDIDNLFSDIENNYANQTVGGLILISDGIYNKGANPTYRAKNVGFPIYSVALGDTIEKKDVSIQKVNHNEVAYLGNVFPIEVLVNAKKFVGQKIEVSIFQKGIKKAGQSLNINNDNFSGVCTFTFNADVPGVQLYNVAVTVLKDELNTINNFRQFAVDVIDNREKILILATYPHPDVAAIKECLMSTSTYEVDYTSALEFTGSVKPYSLVILHGVNTSQQKIMNDCKNLNVPVFLINPEQGTNLLGININGATNKYNDAETFVNKSFGLFNVSDGLKNFISDAPALKTFFGNYSVSNGVNAVIYQRIGEVETAQPVLYFNELNGLKTACFLGDGLWKWKMRDFAEHNNHILFTELITKSVQYLAVKSDKSFFRVKAQKIVNENEEVDLSAELYNKSYEPINSTDVFLTLTNEDKKEFNYTFSKTASAYQLNLGKLNQGIYTWVAKVNYNAEVLIKKGSITVRGLVTENLNSVADHNLLYKLSSQSDGKLFYPTNVNAIEKEIFNNPQIKPITYTQAITNPLINLKWLFFVITLFLAVEWWLRKRYTLI
jgi:hypothetical protein